MSRQAGAGKQDKLSQVQRQADDVTNVMRQNIEKTMQRGDQLDELDDKSVRLEESAQRFQKSAVKVNRMFCLRSWRNMAIIVVLCIVVLVLILWAAGAFK